MKNEVSSDSYSEDCYEESMTPHPSASAWRISRDQGLPLSVGYGGCMRVLGMGVEVVDCSTV